VSLAKTAFVHVFCREPLAAADCAGRALRICEEHRIASVQAHALGARGWALSASGEGEKGLAQIAQGVESYGLGAEQHILLALQADALLAIGKPEAALASVAAGLKVVEKTGGAQLEAELYRLKREALLAGAGTASEAEAAMQEAIAVARRQNAKSWELRGATSLAGCGPGGAVVPKPATSSLRFTAGPPRGSTPPISKRQRHSLLARKRARRR
jgi:predicted ATPase